MTPIVLRQQNMVMSMNDCAGTGQKQFTWFRISDWQNHDIQIDTLYASQKISVMGPMGPKTKNGCAGEGQQQITALH
jgi:hypothetical protein